MKTRLASTLRLSLMAGALALVVTGCSTNPRYADRSTDRTMQPAGYVGPTSTAGTPASVDAFSSSYVPFPASSNESAGVMGHSTFCTQHYNQPGCQTFDQVTRNDRPFRFFNRDRRD